MFKTPRYKKFIKEITKEYYRVHGYKERDPKEQKSTSDAEPSIEPKKEEPSSGYVSYSLDVDTSGIDYFTPDVKSITDEFKLYETAYSSFHDCLFYILDETKLSDVKFYKAAGFDRRLFSTIRSNKDYQPSRDTALACCIALGISEKEIEALLMTAGYALARNRRDAAIKFCIKKGIKKVAIVNDVLDAIGEKTIGR